MFVVAAEDPCDSDPCREGGTCRRRGLSFECTCRPGCSGRACEEGLCPVLLIGGTGSTGSIGIHEMFEELGSSGYEELGTGDEETSGDVELGASGNEELGANGDEELGTSIVPRVSASNVA